MTTLAAVAPTRILEPDGMPLDVFALPTDSASLEELIRDLFENHWRDIVFGTLIEGAAWEMRADGPPSRIGVLDGYITVAFGVPHFHICIGETKGIAQQSDAARSGEAAAHRARRALPPNAPGLRSDVLGSAAFQRRAASSR